MKTKSFDILKTKSIFIWLAAAVAAILMMPLIAMQFTDDVNWSPFDFLVAAVLLFGAGTLFILVARKTPNTSKRIAIGVLVSIVLIYIWAELAVGIFTNLGN